MAGRVTENISYARIYVHKPMQISHGTEYWLIYVCVTQIQDLVSNTNYTLHIAGVTGKGVGASTTVFIYIRATLEGEPHITTECKSAGGRVVERSNQST